MENGVGPRDNSGILFGNDYRGQNEKAPHMRGTAKIAGAEYAVAAWSRQGKKGKFLTLNFTPAEEAARIKAEREAKRAAKSDEDLPF